MEKPLNELYRVLQKMAGLHRQLLDVVRKEKVSLTEVDLKEIQNCTATKQALIEAIYVQESIRIRLMEEIALLWKQPVKNLTLPSMAISLQKIQPKMSEQLRGLYNILTILVQRITDQNQANLVLIEKSIGNIHEMKINAISELSKNSQIYTQSGQKQLGNPTVRIFSQEA